MNNKSVGTIFCLIAAILACVHYVVAAIYVSGAATISAEVFSAALTAVGPALVIAAIVALVIGAGFLILGFVKDGKKA